MILSLVILSFVCCKLADSFSILFSNFRRIRFSLMKSNKNAAETNIHQEYFADGRLPYYDAVEYERILESGNGAKYEKLSKVMNKLLNAKARPIANQTFEEL